MVSTCARNVLLTIALSGLFAAAACASGPPVPKGERLLGLAVSEAEDKNYNAAMELSRAAGVQVVSLKLDWDDVEKQPRVYKTPWLKVANMYYPPRKIPLSLHIATLDTNRNRVPADLRGKPFDDPAVIERFTQFLDFVFDGLPDVTLTDFSIGNEVDGVLGADAAKWKQYAGFFAAGATTPTRDGPA